MAQLAPIPRDTKPAVYRLDLESEPVLDRSSEADQDRDWIAPLWQQNAAWFCRLRWLVIAVLGAASLGALWREPAHALGLDFAPAWPLSAALFLTISNLVFVNLIGRTEHSPARVPVKALLWAQIVSDLLVLTAVVYWLEPSVAAAPFMFLFHIILACIVFTAKESLGVAALAMVLYLGSLLVESAGWLPRSSLLAGQLSTHSPRVLDVVSMLLIWCVIWYLVSRLASAFRSRDRELFISNRRLKASIEERSNHMLQTTHQLKAPFAAIHAQTQLLLGEYCGALPGPARLTVEKISARCLVLARQIQEMLQLANLRSQGQTAPPRRQLNLGTLVEEVITRVEPAARERGIRFETQIHAVTVEAVEDHLTMLLDNVVVNAVNYSYENGVVKVFCGGQNTGNALLVVRDQGIGIPKEKLPRIFDDYYRTEEAVQHNRGSTGLGLAIVRQVACKDRVPITVESAPGWGTRFTLTIPGVPPASPTSNLNN